MSATRSKSNSNVVVNLFQNEDERSQSISPKKKANKRGNLSKTSSPNTVQTRNNSKKKKIDGLNSHELIPNVRFDLSLSAEKPSTPTSCESPTRSLGHLTLSSPVSTPSKSNRKSRRAFKNLTPNSLNKVLFTSNQLKKTYMTQIKPIKFLLPLQALDITSNNNNNNNNKPINNLWDYFSHYLKNYSMDYLTHCPNFTSYSQEIQFAFGLYSSLLENPELQSLFSLEELTQFQDFQHKLTNHLTIFINPSSPILYDDLLEGIRICEHFLHTMNHNFSRIQTQCFPIRQLYSRVLLHMILYHLLLHEPHELLFPSKVINYPMNSLVSESDEAKQTLSSIELYYLSDCETYLLLYLQGLNTNQTTFDLFFGYIIALYGRLTYAPSHIMIQTTVSSNEYAPYAGSYKFIYELQDIFMKLLTISSSNTTATTSSSLGDNFVSQSNPSQRADYEPYYTLITQEFACYQILITKEFDKKIPPHVNPYSLRKSPLNSKHNTTTTTSTSEKEDEESMELDLSSPQNKPSTSTSNDSTVTSGGNKGKKTTVKEEWSIILTKEPELKIKYPTLHTFITELIGLESVKRHVIQLFHRVRLEKRRGGKIESLSLNFRFVGNPGVGKTHVARLFARILAELGLRQGITQQQLEEETRTKEQLIKDQQQEEYQQLQTIKKDIEVQRLKLYYEHEQERLKFFTDNKELVTNVLQCSKLTIDSTNPSSLVDVSLKNLENHIAFITDDYEQSKQLVNEKLQKYEQKKKELIQLQDDLDQAKAALIQSKKDANAARTKQRFIETSGGLLATKGPDYFDMKIQSLLQATPPGGVIFIDETHQLITSSSPAGKDVIQRLIQYSENNRDVLTFILAGYEKEMENMIDTDHGLASRFPRDNMILFEDYEAHELTEIFFSFLSQLGPDEQTSFHLEDPNLAHVLGRRLSRGRGHKGFGNARTVRTWLDSIMKRNAERITQLEDQQYCLLQDEYMMLTQSDVLGIEPNPLQSKPFQQLNQMIGLTKVKTEIETIMKSLKLVWDADLYGEPCPPPHLNRLFVGPPGTGKTTVAQIYGNILKESGFLSSGEVILKNPSDFLGSVVGESETKTKKIFESCRGKVLVIDEAYGLGQDTPFHKAVLDTIVAEVPSEGGGDCVVILVGYQDEIDEMIRKANPGLSRRFSQKITFDSYSPKDLQLIFTKRAKSQRVSISFKVIQRIGDYLEIESKIRNFGNAGAAINLFDKLKSIAMKRIERNDGNLKMISITNEDIDELTKDDTNDMKIMNIHKELDNYVEELECQMMTERAINGSTPAIQHVIFVGPAGTGKTTSARYLAKLMKLSGLLPTNKLVEVSGETLVASYLGQTKSIVTSKLEEALGGVLFIDEAHRLRPKSGADAFKDEALGVLIGATTNPIYQNKLLIVLAGYTDEMDALLNYDQGLKRRFSKRIEFQNISAKHAVDILHTKLTQQNYSFEEETISNEMIESFFQELMLRPGYGNLGDVDNFMLELRNAASKRLGKIAKQLPEQDRNHFFTSWKRIFELSDYLYATKTLLASRPPAKSKDKSHHLTKDMTLQDILYPVDHAYAHKSAEKLILKENLQEIEPEVEPMLVCEENMEVVAPVVEILPPSNPTNGMNKQEKRMILDILNQIFQQYFVHDFNQLNALFAQGSSHPLYAQICQEAQVLLQQQETTMINIPEKIIQTMHDWKQIYAQHEEIEDNQLTQQQIIDQLQEIDINDHEDDGNENNSNKSNKKKHLKNLLICQLTALKTKLQATIVICGVCGRANNTTSGCSYMGNSPKPIIMSIDAYNEKGM